eukprot:10312620-Heterocapsa_arctica.AAC.1
MSSLRSSELMDLPSLRAFSGPATCLAALPGGLGVTFAGAAVLPDFAPVALADVDPGVRWAPLGLPSVPPFSAVSGARAGFSAAGPSSCGEPLAPWSVASPSS